MQTSTFSGRRRSVSSPMFLTSGKEIFIESIQQLPRFVVGRIMAPWDVHVLLPRPRKWVGFEQRGTKVVDRIKVANQLILRCKYYPTLSGWTQLTHREPYSWTWEKELGEAERWACESPGPVLLALKTEDWGMSQKMQVAPQCWKGQEADSSSAASGKNRALLISLF